MFSYWLFTGVWHAADPDVGYRQALALNGWRMACLIILSEVFRYGGGLWKQSLLELLGPGLHDFLHTHSAYLHRKLGCCRLICVTADTGHTHADSYAAKYLRQLLTYFVVCFCSDSLTEWGSRYTLHYYLGLLLLSSAHSVSVGISDWRIVWV